MRQIVADGIAANPDHYNEAFLDGKSNAEYQRWIMDDSSWGGAIELNILSGHFHVEIDVVNTQTSRIDQFSDETLRLTRRVLLIYDGIHYDALVLESADGLDRHTIFSTSDDEVLGMAQELAAEAQSSRQFTDVSTFRLRCLDCQVIVIGQKGAYQHTNETRHTNFGEI